MNKKIEDLLFMANKEVVGKGLTFDKGLDMYTEILSKLVVEECAKIAEANGHVDTATEIRSITEDHE
jgi:hypothetical protein